MNQYDIIFPLNNEERILMEFEDKLEKIPCYCLRSIFFIHNQHKYCIAYYSIEDNIRRLKDLLVDALDNKLRLHESITQNIGFLENVDRKYNQRYPNTFDDTWKTCPDLVYDYTENEYFSWIGYRYQLWADENLATWIYNDKNGAIVFEITQQYPYFFAKNKKTIKIPFQKWMRSYKPFIVRTISKEVAQEWIKTANYVIAVIEERLKG